MILLFTIIGGITVAVLALIGLFAIIDKMYL
jgi:hypothetical protein